MPLKFSSTEKSHGGTIAVAGRWTDAITGEQRYRYAAVSHHKGEAEAVHTYTRSAAEFILWAIDERVRGEAFRNAVAAG